MAKTIVFQQEIKSMNIWIKIYAVMSFIFLFSSCAAILNQLVQKIIITTGKNVKVTLVEKAVLSDSSSISSNASIQNWEIFQA